MPGKKLGRHIGPAKSWQIEKAAKGVKHRKVKKATRNEYGLFFQGKTRSDNSAKMERFMTVKGNYETARKEAQWFADKLRRIVWVQVDGNKKMKARRICPQ